MESPKVQFNKNSEERRKRRTKFLFVALLLLVIIIVGAVGFLRKESFQVTQVEISGTRALDPREIIRKTRDDFSGNYLWLIPKSNILLFSKRSLRAQLLNQFPGIESLDISFRNKNTVSITVHEKAPTDIWCKDATTCYFIDDSGLIYKPAPSFSEGVFVTFTGNTIELPEDVIRARFVSVAEFGMLRSLIQQLNAYPVSITGIRLDPQGDIMLSIDQIKTYSLGTSTQLLITDQVSVATMVDNLSILMNDKTFTNGLLAKGGDLETIDFRFPAKIYYKFKNGASIPSESATTTQR